MGLIILIAIGAILGWLASIIMRTDNQQDALLNIVVGIGGALISGLFISDISVMTGISAGSLLAGFGGSALMLALLNLVRINAVN